MFRPGRQPLELLFQPRDVPFGETVSLGMGGHQNIFNLPRTSCAPKMVMRELDGRMKCH
jgi:hypothetical protein